MNKPKPQAPMLQGRLNVAIICNAKTRNAIIKLFRYPLPTRDIRIVGLCSIDFNIDDLPICNGAGILKTEYYQDVLEIADLDVIIDLTGEKSVIADLQQSQKKHHQHY